MWLQAKYGNSRIEFSGWFTKYRWWIISVLGLLLLFLEFGELYVRGANFVDGSEIVIYIALLWIIGSLIDRVLKTLEVQNQTVNLLDSRHKLSINLIKHEDWEGLASELAKFPSTIAPIARSVLYVRNPGSSWFELIASWSDEPENGNLKRNIEVCQGCLKRNSRDLFLSQPCLKKEINEGENFCFQINHGYEMLAILHIAMRPGKNLSSEQKEILWNIREEMAVALKAGLDRRRLAELQIAKTVLSERRNVSHYLHDHLGQNLSFINLKINQFLTEKNQQSLQSVRGDLENIKEAVNQSYEIVRGKLETTHPETAPLLTNFLKEHAKKVSLRAGFEVQFTITGEAAPVSQEIQRALFYVFQEALGNIEKHARARKVNIIILFLWNSEELRIQIKDDGRGFDLNGVESNKHFGIQIMQERISKIDGWIEVNSKPHSGTTVLIMAPLPIRESLLGV